MAAPESPLCYVGVARQSAAFRLMKQMVNPPSLIPPFNSFSVLYTYLLSASVLCIMLGLGRRRRSRKREAGDQRTRSSPKQTRHYWFLLPLFFFFFFFFLFFFFVFSFQSYFSFLSLLQSLCLFAYKFNYTGIGLEKPNQWAFDTTQFDNILKRLKVVCFFLTFFFFVFVQILLLFAEILFFLCDLYSKRRNHMTKV